MIGETCTSDFPSFRICINKLLLSAPATLSPTQLSAAKKICADLGCSTGGFVDCLLKHDAAKVYAIDTGYGVLDWKLRNDERVVVMERTNAMHVELPEPIQIVTIDVAWTKQKNILPSARRLVTPTGIVVTLIKPHYEAPAALLRKGVLPEEDVDQIVKLVKADVLASGFKWVKATRSPIKGAGGNIEVLALLSPLP
jgi:23S rRNA (cytidine1920-2'-O)/16S rRNA (cytidine1409-2'-O)-methyltransferase